jgi:hypothetical protein
MAGAKPCGLMAFETSMHTVGMAPAGAMVLALRLQLPASEYCWRGSAASRTEQQALSKAHVLLLTSRASQGLRFTSDYSRCEVIAAFPPKPANDSCRFLQIRPCSTLSGALSVVGSVLFVHKLWSLAFQYLLQWLANRPALGAEPINRFLERAGAERRFVGQSSANTIDQWTSCCHAIAWWGSWRSAPGQLLLLCAERDLPELMHEPVSLTIL